MEESTDERNNLQKLFHAFKVINKFKGQTKYFTSSNIFGFVYQTL
jgi:hypothetical protein